jgi:hypothetical protein
MGDHVESKEAAAAADIPNQCGNNFKLVINKEGKETVRWHKRIYSAG